MKPARGALRNNIPGYAGGGLIDGLKRAVGMAPSETMREKFARQDAERMAKQAPPVPKPVMTAPEGQTAVTSYAAGTLTGDRKKQMDEAIGKKVGGAIRGKGTGTSDEIPIMASNGEFMIKASSVKKIGIEALEALNAIGDQPDEKDSPAEAAREYGDAESSAEDKKEPKGAEKAGYKCGGAVRKMATGGLVDPTTDPNATTPAAAPVPPAGTVQPTAAPAVAPVATAPATQNPFYTPGSAQDPKASVNIIAGGKSPFGGPTPGEQAIATPPKPQGALRTPSLMATAPAAVTPTPAIPPIQPPVLKMATGGMVDEEKKRADAVAKYQADLASANANAANNVAVKNTSLAPEGGASATSNYLAAVQKENDLKPSYFSQATPSGALRSEAAKVDTALAAEKLYAPATPQPAPQTTAAVAPPDGAVRPPAVPVVPAPVAAPAAPPVAATPAQPAFDPLAAKAERDAQTQKDISLGNQMEATRKASEAEGYAAQDRGIDTSIAIASKVDAERARQRAENTLSSTTDNAATRAQKGEASRALAALDGQQAQTAGNEAAARRSNQADQTQRRGQDIQAGALRQSSQFNQQLARDKFGIEQSQESRAAAKDALDAKQRDRLQAAFDAYDKDPSEKAAERVRVLMGKEKAPAPDLYDKVQTGVDPTTNAPIYSLYNKRTGEMPGQQTKVAPPAKALEMLKANPKLAAEFDAKYGQGASAQFLAKK